MDEMEVMFIWTDSGLCLQITLDTGEELNYEFDDEESYRLFEFLAEKFEPKSIISKVLKKLTDTNSS